VKYLSVKGFNGCIALDAHRHLDKREAFRAAGIVISDDGHRFDLPVGTKQVSYIHFAEFVL